MVAPFNEAWMLLKQRGHELNLPPSRMQSMGNPQDLTDRRVDEATMARGALDEFEHLNSLRYPTISNSREAKNELGRRQEITNEMESQMSHAKAAEINERMAENMQGDLDRAILARMGQQPEADEMEAMGVPPMSRTLSATPPPNIGRAGSSDTDVNQREPPNPFPKPLGENVRGDLMDWAAGAGREASMPGIVERTENPFEDLTEMHDSDMYDEIHDEPLHENNPAAHNIASINLRASPRQQKRGQMDSGRAEFKRPDREGPIGMSPSQRALRQLGL